MNLGRQAISATQPPQIIDVRFDADGHIFTCSTPEGFAVYRTYPLTLVRTREITGGTLSIVLPLHSTSLLFLVGGGRSPRYPPNKVIFWDDAQGKDVAELEFREQVRGLACRRQCLIVALRRRVVAFEIKDSVRRIGEWDTADNERGLVALATGPNSTLMAIPGQQTGHVQLIHLTPCPPPPVNHTPGAQVSRHAPPSPSPAPVRRHPVSHIIAHDSALSTISVSLSGRLIATTSEKGTLIRIWDAQSGESRHEFRRGIGQANIYGVAFRPDERECCVWSDKGTIHVFSLDGASNRTSVWRQMSALLPAVQPYINSEWSYAQFRLPTPPAHVAHSMSQTNRLGVAHPDAGDEERCTVAWIEIPQDPTPVSSPAKQTSPLPSSSVKGKGFTTSYAGQPRSNLDKRRPQSPPSALPPPQVEYQLVALTYGGGWFRLSLPNASKDRPSRPGSPVGKNRSTKPGGTSVSGRSSLGGGASPKLGHLAVSQSSASKKNDPSRRNSEPDNITCELEEFRRFGRWDGWG